MTEDRSNNQEEHERRRFFRIDDEVGLRLKGIASADEEAAVDDFLSTSAHVGLLNELRAMRNDHLPQKRSLEYKFPTVATYIHIIERQIDTIALAIDSRSDFPETANQRVSLSAQGISLKTEEPFPLGSMVDVKMTLFPGPCRIEALAHIVRCEHEDGDCNLALDFTHIRNADREALIRHVYTLQRHRLQARFDED